MRDLLYVGPATTKKLGRHGITTIGDLARTSVAFPLAVLGKVGVMLWRFANGMNPIIEKRVNGYS